MSRVYLSLENAYDRKSNKSDTTACITNNTILKFVQESINTANTFLSMMAFQKYKMFPPSEVNL